jgi:hypothetical protein
MSFLDDIFNAVANFLGEIESAVTDVLNIKEIAQEELTTLIADLTKATSSLKDFEARVKTLRGRVIRADIAFEFIDEIRSGELRDFVTTTLTDLKSTVLSTLDGVISAGQEFKVVKQSGPINIVKSFIGLIQKIYKGYAIVASLLHALHQIVPIVEKISAKLETFEDIILPQDSVRTVVTDTYRKRNAASS